MLSDDILYYDVSQYGVDWLYLPEILEMFNYTIHVLSAYKLFQ